MIHWTLHKPASMDKRMTVIHGQAIPYILKRSPRAKHIRLEVKQETGLTVVIPYTYKDRQLPQILESKGRWILSTLAKHRVESLSAERGLKNGDAIPYLGRDLKIVIRANMGIDSVKLQDNRLIVTIKSRRNGTIELALERWYRMQATKLIKERAEKLSAQQGFTYNELVIRRQRTRWGSCSHKKTLSFNWKLIMVPEPVIDYVIIHELSHIKEMNHSKKFWEIVAKHCPRWREHRKWLKEHEVQLAARFSIRTQH